MQDLLFQDGDIVANEFGDIVICQDEYADIVQTANNNIMLKYGNNIYHQELGNKIFSNRVKANSTGLEDIRTECKSAILNGDIRVSDIKSMNATILDDAKCMIDYRLILAEDGSEVDGKTAINIFNMEGGE